LAVLIVAVTSQTQRSSAVNGVDAVTVAAGGEHTCALSTSGGLKCWGANVYGQIGDGTNVTRLTATPVTGMTSGVAAIDGGVTHTCAATTTGALFCWGRNVAGQLGDGTTTNRSTPTAVSGLSSVVAVAGGREHTCALTEGGAVYCWGDNSDGQLGDGTTTPHLTPAPVAGLSSGVVAINSGDNHVCALTSAGGLKCWGMNIYGQLGVGTNGGNDFRTSPTNVVGMASGVAGVTGGGYHTCAYLTSGAVRCWGWNLFGQIGDDSNLDRNIPTQVVGLTSGIVAMTTGGTHSCALSDAGSLKCWGDNAFGQVGDGTRIDKKTPVDVVGMGSGVTVVTGAGDHTCVRATQLYCWGLNAFGQLGDGTTTRSYVAVLVVGLGAKPGPTATPTDTPTPTPTPTPIPKDPDGDLDGDTIANGADPDDDNDGCGDLIEQQTLPGSEVTGGRRHPHNFWDFFDVPVGPMGLRDRAVAAADIGAVVARFGTMGDPGGNPLSPAPPAGYHTAFDRGGSLPSGQPWNLSPANGSVAGGDIGAVVAQFGHTCA
jgi:alpha-tubulin suppressor-like RCC1 family protein